MSVLKPKPARRFGKTMTVSELGRLGAAAMHAKFTPEERRARALHAINTRWERVRAKKETESAA
jgi:hypothetical protein